jgi:hypothetical protein
VEPIWTKAHCKIKATQNQQTSTNQHLKINRYKELVDENCDMSPGVTKPPDTNTIVDMDMTMEEAIDYLMSKAQLNY